MRATYAQARRGADRALVVGDLPFGSCITPEDAARNGVRLVKEGRCDAVKLEGGERMIPQVKALIDAGVAVVGHLGLTPQSHAALGGYRVQGRTADDATTVRENPRSRTTSTSVLAIVCSCPLRCSQPSGSRVCQMLREALALQEAGCFSVVLELVPAPVATAITDRLSVPTIGIGAGVGTSGQVQVFHDVLGLYDKISPKVRAQRQISPGTPPVRALLTAAPMCATRAQFAKQFGKFEGPMTEALEAYASAVKTRAFPSDANTFAMEDVEVRKLGEALEVIDAEAIAAGKPPPRKPTADAAEGRGVTAGTHSANELHHQHGHGSNGIANGVRNGITNGIANGLAPGYNGVHANGAPAPNGTSLQANGVLSNGVLHVSSASNCSYILASGAANGAASKGAATVAQHGYTSSSNGYANGFALANGVSKPSAKPASLHAASLHVASQYMKPPTVVSTVAEWRGLEESGVMSPRSVGLVPTMGALHQGHLSLMRQAKEEVGISAATVFVNPKQFAAHEDLGTYPRPWEKDLEALTACGVDFVFAPSVDEMYPPNRPQLLSPFIDLNGVDEVTSEGSSRPGFFRGVSTVVAKLLNITQPKAVYFGQKDGMQCVVVRRLIEDLNFNVKLVVGETVREADGLAMSSRNTYLTPPQRAVAPAVYKALQALEAAYMHGGERSVGALKQAATSVLQSATAAAASNVTVELDYLSLASAVSGQDYDEEAVLQGPAAGTDEPTLASIAVRVGTTRLIDNLVLQ